MSLSAHASPWKKDFSLFEQAEYKDLSYLDSAATTLVPTVVAKAVNDYQLYHHGNSHRGFYKLSAESTAIVEKVRYRVSSYIKALSSDEIIFTASTTNAINLVADGFLKQHLTEKHNVLISVAEHHANLLPWQQLCWQTGAQLRVISLLPCGELDLTQVRNQIDGNTALVAVSHISNVLGVKNPIAALSKITQKYDAKLLVDGAQAAAHTAIDVQQLGCDFYVYSGHKSYAGSGIGVLYAKQAVQVHMQPSIYGGGIVEQVTLEGVTFSKGPQQFEAGSRNVAAIVGLKAAIDYLQDKEPSKISAYIEKLSSYMFEQLRMLPFVELVTGTNHSGIVSFNLQHVHSHDVATCLDLENIAVRAGHHCAQPLHHYLNLKSSVRVSLGIYNDKADIDKLIKALTKTYEIMKIE
ncbi:aminotransferase class V-fold PLP-dependent enzyme [Thalassotalea atypica]|uniref:aminotransferase class V-fold PLP-dependent enzyme n=1 Tax=Thalassotalea atypica TaxID=2054316 RepID=UPI0025747C10|nr:cysteine desulfurase [Thalassotalea atypica]